MTSQPDRRPRRRSRIAGARSATVRTNRASVRPGGHRPPQPPTDAEILEAIRRRRERYPQDAPDRTLEQAIDEFFDVLDPPFLGPDTVIFSPHDPAVWELGSQPRSDDLWSDLRASETAALLRIRAGAVDVALRRCLEAIVEGLVAGAQEFGELFPNAPRGGLVVPGGATRDGS